MRNRKRAADVIRFWSSLEMFNPPSVPDLDRALDLQPDDPAPWQADKGTQPDGATWAYTVYGGLFDVSKVERELERVFRADRAPEVARPSDTSAVFAFTVDAEGRIVRNSARLSACAWAMSRLYAPGPGDRNWLRGFDDANREFAAQLNGLSSVELDARAGSLTTAVRERLSSAASGAVEEAGKATATATKTVVATGVAAALGPVVGGIAGSVAGKFVEKLLAPATTAKPGGTQTGSAPRIDLSAAALHELVRDLAGSLGIAEPLGISGVRVQRRKVSANAADDTGEEMFLNSFIAGDLDEIETAVRKGRGGPALLSYLAACDDIRTDARHDVRADRWPLITGVAPDRIPAGCWPGRRVKPLVLSQQFAVNQIVDELADGAGVFAVNGPPGTGKTTMVRDLLADIVVRRARKLAALPRPDMAFTTVVEQVSLSPTFHPRVRALRPELTGFEVVLATATNKAAENVTAELPACSAVDGAEREALAAEYFTDLATLLLHDDRQAWGLIAAVLGKRKHCREFADRFWWDREVGLPHRLGQEPADWGEAVARFRAAERTVAELAAERQDYADAIEAVRRGQTAIPAMEAALGATQQWCARQERAVRHLGEQRRQAQLVFERAEGEHRDHRADKPGFWVSLSTLFQEGRRWAADHRQLRDRRNAARREADRAAHELSAARHQLDQAHRRRQLLAQQLAAANDGVARALGKLDEAGERWPGAVPVGFRDDEDDAFQLCTPWADEEFLTARTTVFLEALRLHKAFLHNAGRALRTNLAVIVDVLSGRGRPKSAAALRAAWQTFFLAVPLVSTTFASLPTLFAGLDEESLGWLLLDEAGQAAPQQAVGGLWRCRRAVIVGDPLQLEPVVTVPPAAQRTLQEQFGVGEEWSLTGSSAQRVADRFARYGTSVSLSSGDGPVWVGAPLRVHRRCDQPMFDICSRIAYGRGFMIHATGDRGEFPGENAWLDVRSAQRQGRWVPAEGSALGDLLVELRDSGVPLDDIRVISPFRHVVQGSREVVAKLRDRRLSGNVSTVHRVQGREADVVVLVLGTGLEDVGARRWAARRPNLLNVAVSRARRRLYVIGNRELWRRQPYFRVLAEELPVRPVRI